MQTMSETFLLIIFFGCFSCKVYTIGCGVIKPSLEIKVEFRLTSQFDKYSSVIIWQLAEMFS